MARRKADILNDIDNYEDRLEQLQAELAALPEGSYQVVAISTDNNTEFSPGRVIAHSVHQTRDLALDQALALNQIMQDEATYEFGPPFVYYVNKVG